MSRCWCWQRGRLAGPRVLHRSTRTRRARPRARTQPRVRVGGTNTVCRCAYIQARFFGKFSSHSWPASCLQSPTLLDGSRSRFMY